MSSMTMMSRARGGAARSQTRRTRVCVAVVLVRTGTGLKLNIPHDVNHHAARPRQAGISLLSQGSKEVEREPSKVSLLQKRRSPSIDCCYEEKVEGDGDDDVLEVHDKDDENTKKLEGGEDKNNAEQDAEQEAEHDAEQESKKQKMEEDERKKQNDELASTKGPPNEVLKAAPKPFTTPATEQDIHRFALLGKAVAEFHLLVLGKTVSPKDFEQSFGGLEFGVEGKLLSNVLCNRTKLQPAYLGGVHQAIERVGNMTSEERETERQAAEDMLDLDGEERQAVKDFAPIRRELNVLGRWFSEETDTIRARVRDHYEKKQGEEEEDEGAEQKTKQPGPSSWIKIGENIVEQAITMPYPWMWRRYLHEYLRRDLKSGKCAPQLNEVLVLSRTMTVVQRLLSSEAVDSPATMTYAERAMGTGSEQFLWLLDRPFETITKNCGEACRSECNALYSYGLMEGVDMVNMLDEDKRAIQVGKLERMLKKDGLDIGKAANKVARPTQRLFDKFLEKIKIVKQLRAGAHDEDTKEPAQEQKKRD